MNGNLLTQDSGSRDRQGVSSRLDSTLEGFLGQPGLHRRSLKKSRGNERRVEEGRRGAIEKESVDLKKKVFIPEGKNSMCERKIEKQPGSGGGVVMAGRRDAGRCGSYLHYCWDRIPNKSNLR